MHEHRPTSESQNSLSPFHLTTRKCTKTTHPSPLAHNIYSSTMSSSSSDPPKANEKRISAKAAVDPILQNALRYTISAKEYETLHKYIISRSKVLKRNAPSVAKVEKLVVDRSGRGDFNVAAIRASLRLFLVTTAGLKAWEVVKVRLLGGTDNR